jgi:hypothetical protein
VAPRAPWDPVAIRVGGADDVRYRPAAGEACGACGTCDRLGVVLTMPLWIPSLSGTFASGGTEVDADRKARGLDGVVDKLLPDVTTSLEFFFMGRATVSKGPWSISADGFYVSLDETVDWKILDDDTTGSLRGVVGRVFGAWQATTRLGCGPCAPTLAVGPTLGARVFALDLHGTGSSATTSTVPPAGGRDRRVKRPHVREPRVTHVLADYGGFVRRPAHVVVGLGELACRRPRRALVRAARLDGPRPRLRRRRRRERVRDRTQPLRPAHRLHVRLLTPRAVDGSDARPFW